MAFIPSNMQRWSPWNLPGPTLYGYETTDSTATVVVTGYFGIDGPDASSIQFSVNDQINCSCSDGILVLKVIDIDPVTTQASFISIGPNSVNTAAIQDGAVTPIKTTGLAYDDLSNLAATAINAPLIPDTDDTHDLGIDGLRWNELYATSIQAGHTNGNTLKISGWDVDGAAKVDFFTITSSNTPTGVLGSTVTATTQAPLTSDTTIATTEYVDDAVAAAGGGGANEQLSNLDAGNVTINTSLVSDTDVTDDLGSITKRWNNLYAANITTDHTAGHTTVIGAWDVDGGSLTPFLTLTANNTPTGVLGSAITATTQAPLDNSTKLATTAYTDAAVAAAAGGANQALSNLAAVAINTTLVSDTDVTDDLGTQAIRWNNIYTKSIQTGDTAADTLTLSGWDVDGATAVPFFTITANNTPTAVLASSVTATTQAASDNSTKLATTAYADAAAAAASGANVALSNLSGVAINTTLVSDTDNTDDLGIPATRWKNVYATNISTGQTNANTLTLSGWDVDGAVSVPFFTITAANTPTAVLASSVTATTQSANDNSTKIATTAYADAVASAAAPIGATYITQTPNGSLTNEQALSALATGLLKSTTGTGVVSIGVSGTDYVGPATTITIAGTAAEITSSAGAQDLSANRTWTLSLPSALTFTGKTITGGSYASASATSFTFTTGTIGTAVTGVTQSVNDNSTKIATTAYADTQVSTNAANKALGNLASVAINTSLLASSDNAIDLGSGTFRWRQLFGAKISTGTTSGNTLVLSARNTGGSSDTAFITLTADAATPTCVLASSVTGSTQAPLTNNTTMATTAYVDAAVAASPGNAGVTIGKMYPITFGGFSN